MASLTPVPQQTDIAIQNNATGEMDYLNFNGSSLVQSALYDYGLAPDFKIVAHGDFNEDGVPDLVAQNAKTGQVDFLFLDSNANLVASALSEPLPHIVGAGVFGGSFGTLVSQLPNGQLDMLQFNSSGALVQSDLIPSTVGIAPAVGVGESMVPDDPGPDFYLPAFPGLTGSGLFQSDVMLQLADGSLDAVGFSGDFGNLTASASFLLPQTGGFPAVKAVNQTGDSLNFDNEQFGPPSFPLFSRTLNNAAVQMVSQIANGQVDLLYFDAGSGTPYASNLLSTPLQGWSVVDGSAVASQLFPVSPFSQA
jgi:hypothetical protein